MQNLGEPENVSAKSSDSSSNYWNAKSSEKFQSSSLLSENVVYTEEKHSAYNSYYLSYDTVNETSSFSTPTHNSKPSSASSTNSRFKVEDKVSESLSLIGQKLPLVASFEYSPSGKCIKSSLPPKAIHSNSFSNPKRASVSNENPFKSGSTNQTPFKRASNFSNSRQHSSLNKHKPPKSIYKSPSSNFVCSKCGLGYPCTLFLCKRSKTFSIGIVEQESLLDSINSSRNKDTDNSEISSWKDKDQISSDIVLPKHNSKINTLEICSEVNSSKRNSPESYTTLAAKKSCQASSRKSVEDLISRLFPELKNKQLIPNGKEFPKKTKLSKRESEGSNIISDFESTKKIKDVSFTNDTKCIFDEESIIQSVTLDKDAYNVSNLGKTVTSTIANCPVIDSSRSNYDKGEISLSQETGKFLNALTASSPSNHFDDILNSQNSQTINSEISEETESAVLTFLNCQTFNSEKCGDTVESTVLPLPNALVLSSEISDETVPAVLPFSNSLHLSSGISEEVSKLFESVVLTLPNLQTSSSEKSGERIKSEVLSLQNSLVLNSKISDEADSAVLTFPHSQTFNSEKNIESIKSAVLPLPNAFVLRSEISDESESVTSTFSSLQTFSSKKCDESTQSTALSHLSSQNLISETDVESTKFAISTPTNSQILSSEVTDETAPFIPLPFNSQTCISKLNDETKQSAVLSILNSQILSSEVCESESEILTFSNSKTSSPEINDESSDCILKDPQTFSSEISAESIESAVLPLQNALTFSDETESVILTFSNSQALTTEISSEDSDSVILKPPNSHSLNSEISSKIIPVVSASSNSEILHSESNYEIKSSSILALQNSIAFPPKTSEIIECEVLTLSNSESLTLEISGVSTESLLQNSPSFSSEISDKDVKPAVLTLSNLQTLSSEITVKTTESDILARSNSQTLSSEIKGEFIPGISPSLTSKTLSSEINQEAKLSAVSTFQNSQSFSSETSEIIECEVLTLSKETLNSEISGMSAECMPQNSQTLSSETIVETVESEISALSKQTLSPEITNSNVSAEWMFENSQTLNSEIIVETVESEVSALSNSKALSSEINEETKPSSVSTFQNSQSFSPETSEIIECEILTLSKDTLNSEISGVSAEWMFQNSQTVSSEIIVETVESEISALSNSQTLSSEIANSKVSAEWSPQNSQTLSSEIFVETVVDSEVSALSDSQTLSSQIANSKVSAEWSPQNSQTLNSEIANSKVSAEWSPQNSQTLSSEIFVETVVESEVSALSDSQTLSSQGANSKVSAEWAPQNSQTLNSEIFVETVESQVSALSDSQTLSSEVANKTLESAVLTFPNVQTLNLNVISESTESVILTPSNSQTLNSELNNETKSYSWTPAESETCILEPHEISEFEEGLTIPQETINPLISGESITWMPQTSGSEITGETVESANLKLPDSQVLNSETFSESAESVEKNLETSNEIIIDSDVCENKMSVSNEVEENCNFTDVNKDLTNALDMIQQSSINDKNLSSAEICNSLNDIFSENDSSNLSVNEVPNSEIVQTEAIIDMTTSHALTSGDVSNESEIYLQTTCDANISADTETYINLSDLYLGDNPDNCQNILIIQDEDGNIETLYLLQDSNVGEDGVVFAEGSNVETVAGNTSNAGNLLVGNSVDELQKLLISQGITNAADILSTQNPVNNQNEFENLAVADALTAQSNLDEYQNNSVIGNSSEEVLLSFDELPIAETAESEEVLSVAKDQSTGNSHLCVLATKCIEKVENIKDFSYNVENVIKESSSKVENMAEDSSDRVENILLTLSNNREIFHSITSDKKNSHGVADNQDVSDNSLIYDNEDNQNFESNVTEKVKLSQKAKKSISRYRSNIQNTIQDSDYQENRILTENSNKLNKFSQNSILSLPCCSKTPPVNGAVYHSELNNIDSRAVSLTSSYLSTKFKNFLSQKSKKTISCNNLLKRSAKKSACSSLGSSNLHQTLKDSSSNNFDLKRRLEEAKSDEYNCNKRAKKDMLSNIHINSICQDMWPKNRLVALKTFKKPFTSAKKSVLDSREGAMTNFKNKALKTCVPRVSLKTAMKSATQKQANECLASDSNLLSVHISSENVTKQNSSLASNSELKTFIQPEICEIRILPNDYLKRASSLLLNRKNLESENADENMSDEEIKMPSGSNSPIRELMSYKSTCTCTAQEMPCICNDNTLQLICEGEDSMDNNIVPCENSVSKQYLLTPSSEVKHRAFCDIHISRLRQHHCCPKCGIFCSQGEFLRCASDESENKENHLFHMGCFIIPAAGLPPSCPHCCKFSCFNVVSLVYKSSADSEHKEVPSDSQNIAPSLNGCDIYMSVHQTPKTVTVSESKIFVPGTNEMQQMITSLAKEKALRLRPTGKCLYNPIRTGDVQKVMQLIGNGVNPNHKFRAHSNNTPLHVAAYYGWIGILHILIQAGALIDAVNDDLETPLIVAVERKQLPIIRYLIHAGVQIDVKDCNGMTSFHIACKNGFKEIAEFLYDTGRIDVNLQDDGGWTSLVWACEHKHLDLVRWLLEIGSDPNVRDNEENTVLHWSAYSGESEIAQLFLDKGCTLSYVNKHGDSALHIAARENNFECVKLFATKGAVLDQKNKNNQTPLMCCEDDSQSYNYLCQCISSGTLKLRKMQLEKHVVFRDISRGAESYPIQAINEVDAEEFIMEFRYVVRNCHRSGVEIISTVNNMQFCCCKDNCITRECSCTMNSKCWYDANGCLSADFDVFWPPTIFECNKTCHCPRTCINRVVQQGLRCPLQLYRTRFQGWGVRTLQDVPKGAFVCEYVGELITGIEATDRDDDTYFFDLESKDADYCLDGRYYGNVARFLNHSCEPNLIAVKVFVDHQDLNFPRIAFFTLRHIKPFEELCFDYGLDFWIVKSQSILCTCNTPSCKYSKDTIDETFQKFYRDTKAENETPTDSVSTAN